MAAYLAYHRSITIKISVHVLVNVMTDIIYMNLNVYYVMIIVRDVFITVHIVLIVLILII